MPFIARKQLHLNHVVPERPKGGINLYVELGKHKLDQIAVRNIRMSLDKRIAFKSKATASQKKNVQGQMI